MSNPMPAPISGARLRRMAKAILARVAPVGQFLTQRKPQRDPPGGELESIRGQTTSEQSGLDALQFVPPGHFYSPIPSLGYVRANENRLFGPPARTLPGIDLREPQQLDLLHSFVPYYNQQPFPERRTEARRYFFENPAYSYSDAMFLYFMIRHARPRRIVEVGSGYSSCVMLDTNELFFDRAIDLTFVEPYPDLLRSLMRPGDERDVTIRACDAQSIEPQLFEHLKANDILFIDSTHVSKIGSDVNSLFFEILPRLAPGVYIHLHDIFYPFEYPSVWIFEGRSWSEAYLLRSFLSFNAAFEIVAFNTFLELFHEEFFRVHMPLCLKNRGGSIWLRRTGCEA
jgi:predicted O-methyltransferase YrrM